jgi:hypothetical protein
MYDLTVARVRQLFCARAFHIAATAFQDIQRICVICVQLRLVVNLRPSVA